MRAVDENGKWLPKAHKVYELNESGERIRLPSGEWKSHKENMVDGNDRKYAEVWRTEWANTVNRYFEKYGIAERLDLRSFARQGKDELPTVHLGPAVAHMKQKGIATEIGNYNRQIKLHNDKLKKLKRVLLDYKDLSEDGVDISGGEAQKIAIARALYKDAPFIILDEPTAALDPIAEAEIYSKFDEIAGDKTAIYISHRLSSCKFCDEIAVFREGAVIQQGTHDELVADESGKYYELWHAQAQYYTA